MQHKQRLISLFVLVALLLSACQPLPPPPVAGAQTPNEDVTAAVNAIWEEYAASVIASDADRWIAQWTEDGVQMPPNEPLVEGKENILARTGGFMAAAPTHAMEITNLEVQSAGEWAYSRGVYTVNFTFAETGEEGTVDGKFMTILQRQSDGSWKIYRDIFNSNVPPANAPAPVVDVEAVTDAVLAIWDEYEASILAGDADRWIALWAEDGVQLPPGAPAVNGKEAIYAGIVSDLDTFEYTEFVITPEELSVNGDMAISRGVYSLTFVAKTGGDPMQLDGKYMTHIRQQPDGSWKIYRDIFNSNVPPATPEADIAALSAELHGRFSQNDLEGAAELAAEDIHMIGYGLGLDFTGRDKFLGFMQARKSVFPDITLEYTNVVVQGDQVVVEFVATGTHLGTMNTPNGPIEATGKPVTLHVVEIHTWKDGKLVHLVQYQDPTAPLKQIGAME